MEGSMQIHFIEPIVHIHRDKLLAHAARSHYCQTLTPLGLELAYVDDEIVLIATKEKRFGSPIMISR